MLAGSGQSERRWPATFLCILLALSVALPGKFALEDWFNNHSYGGLHDAISDRGDSQWSFFAAAGFRDHDPFDCLGLVGAFAEVLFYVEQTILAVFAKVPCADAVNATSPCVVRHFFPSQSEGPVRIDFVYEAEPHV